MASVSYTGAVRSLTIRLPDEMAAQLEAESRRRHVTKSDVVRERLQSAASVPPSAADAIADLIGSVDDRLPADLSARRKRYLKTMGYGRKRPR